MTKSRQLLIAALAGAFLSSALPAFAANAPQPPQITNPAVGRPLRQAMQLAETFNFPEAIAMAQQARNADGATTEEVAYIDRMIRQWTEVAKNPEAIDEEIAEQLREGRRSIGLLKNCADIAIVLTKAGKYATCPDATRGQ
jgi:hypothetical protein